MYNMFGRTTETTAGEARRREILVAALRLIAGNGTDAVTHRRIAAAAQVPLGSLTYYFDSREELIREAFRFYISEATAFLIEVQEEIPPNSPEALIDLIAEIMRREFAEPAMIHAEYELILHAARDEQIAREFAAWERNLEARLAEPLEAMGVLRPLYAARTILHLVRGFELEQIAGRSERPGDLRERLKIVVEALIPKNTIAPRESRPAPRRTHVMSRSSKRKSA